ncbi:hypothetical protein IEN85_14315 [Pelagicoccus sp. NFK12]|uniref:Uncharacterized protein n=1 Tax=Pelagicoccus enzymogenes TaxID=2773457 RepID=A0A927FAB5_9BACT|nr:hypothetical protein [Pelagicoccus enzymogenes]MBD5780671.1 hypothetical protein [Pelagicoccus enzymogenes]
MYKTDKDPFESPEKIEDAIWCVQKSEVQPTLIVKPTPGFVVCDVPKNEEGLRNSALLAAAPQLLKACKQVDEAFKRNSIGAHFTDIDLSFLRAAIELATTTPSLPPDEEIDKTWE